MSSEYDIDALIGRTRFLRLQMRKGGTRIYIHAHEPHDGEMASIVGPSAAEILSAHLGGELIHITLSAMIRERNRVITAMRVAGFPAELIGSLFGLKARTIRGIVQGIDPDTAVMCYGTRARRFRWIEQRGRNSCQETTKCPRRLTH